MADNILQHIDIREEGKENAFSLGKSLWIAGEVSSLLVLCGKVTDSAEFGGTVRALVCYTKLASYMW